MQFQAFAIEAGVRVGRIVILGAAVGETCEYVRNVEIGVAAIDIVPDVDRFVAFRHRKRANTPPPIGSILVWDTHVAAVLVPLPAVERTHDSVALHMTAITQMGAEVFAIGIHHGQRARGGSPGHHLATEILHPVDVTGANLGGPCDLEPSRRLHRQRRLCHRSCPFRAPVPRGSRRPRHAPRPNNSAHHAILIVTSVKLCAR